jgi:hypothetical protein
MVLDLMGVALRTMLVVGVVIAVAARRDRSMRSVARTRWPYALVLVPVVAVDVIGQFAPRPRGHWSGHLLAVYGSVAVTIGLLLVAIIASRAGWARLLLVPLAVGLLVAAAGNWRVATSIWATPYGDDDVRASLADDPEAFESGHDLASRSDPIVYVSGIAFVAAVGITRRPRRPTLAVASVLAIMPPWILGGVGALFLLSRCAVEQRRDRLLDLDGDPSRTLPAPVVRSL